jgi:tetratricopeptide (TPR) repeat protein
LKLYLALFLAFPAAAAENQLVDAAFEHFYNLEYEPALKLFQRAERQNPASPDIHNHIAQTLMFREMYRNGALESELVSGNDAFLRRPKLDAGPDVQERFQSELQSAMDLAQARLRANQNDPEALFAMGISHGLRSNWDFLVRRAWMDALREATAGRKLHNRITEMDPDNVDARFMQGMHDYVVGNLPLMYKMLGFLAGFRGDKQQGIRTVELVAQRGERNKVDAEVILCVLYRREKRYKEALPLLDDLIQRFPRNYLLWFERAQMYSNLGDKEGALASVNGVADRKSRGKSGFVRVPWEKIRFQLGTIQFWYNDLDEALENFREVCQSERELDLNTEVLTWMRIGQIHDLRNRRTDAIQAYRKAIAAAPNAAAARESRRYLSSPYRREKS